MDLNRKISFEFLTVANLYLAKHSKLYKDFNDFIKKKKTTNNFTKMIIHICKRYNILNRSFAQNCFSTKNISFKKNLIHLLSTNILFE